MKRAPSAQDTRRVLEGLASGTLAAKEAADWARQYIVPFNPDITGIMGEVLDHLLGADGLVSNGIQTEPLFTQEVFREWLRAFRPRLLELEASRVGDGVPAVGAQDKVPDSKPDPHPKDDKPDAAPTDKPSSP